MAGVSFFQGILFYTVFQLIVISVTSGSPRILLSWLAQSNESPCLPPGFAKRPPNHQLNISYEHCHTPLHSLVSKQSADPVVTTCWNTVSGYLFTVSPVVLII